MTVCHREFGMTVCHREFEMTVCHKEFVNDFANFRRCRYMNFQDNIKPQFLANLRRPGYMNFQKKYETSFLANFRRPGHMKFQNNIKRHYSWISIASCLLNKRGFFIQREFAKSGAQSSLWLPFGLKEEASKEFCSEWPCATENLKWPCAPGNL